MTSPRIFLTLTILAAAPATVFAQIPVGTRVGTMTTTPSGYDDGGRRDPFVSLVAVKKSLPPTRIADRSGVGLKSMSLADVRVTGIARVGKKFLATIEGPDKKSFNVSLDDQLADASVKSIDTEGVVFLEVGDPTLGLKPKEVRKTLRRVTEEIR